MVNKLSKDREKICNLCGESILKFTIIDNAPLCENCVPIKPIKKLANGTTMLNAILKKWKTY